MQGVRAHFPVVVGLRKQGRSWTEIADVLASHFGVVTREEQPLSVTALRSAFFMVGVEGGHGQDGHSSFDLSAFAAPPPAEQPAEITAPPAPPAPPPSDPPPSDPPETIAAAAQTPATALPAAAAQTPRTPEEEPPEQDAPASPSLTPEPPVPAVHPEAAPEPEAAPVVADAQDPAPRHPPDAALPVAAPPAPASEPESLPEPEPEPEPKADLENLPEGERIASPPATPVVSTPAETVTAPVEPLPSVASDDWQPAPAFSPRPVHDAAPTLAAERQSTTPARQDDPEPRPVPTGTTGTTGTVDWFSKPVDSAPRLRPAAIPAPVALPRPRPAASLELPDLTRPAERPLVGNSSAGTPPRRPTTAPPPPSVPAPATPQRRAPEDAYKVNWTSRGGG